MKNRTSRLSPAILVIKGAIGGIAREFYQRVRKHYAEPSRWKWQDSGEYRSFGQSRTDQGEEANPVCQAD